MAAATLGKRTRSSAAKAPETSLELPAKRQRRSLRSSAASTKPATVLADITEDRENHQPQTESEQSPEPEDATDLSPPKISSRRTSIASTAYSAAPVTPSTSRHYDAFAKPTATPRHRVMSVGKLARRMTPNTPLTPSSVQTVYHQARQLFARSADPGQLIGRDQERTKLRDFFARCSTSQPGGCLYVSGPPGTGKSAMTNEITKEVAEATPSVRRAYINCMSVKSSKDLYMSLFDQLVGETDTSESDVVTILQKLFVPKKKTEDAYLVVLDEIDHILTLDLESLYRVFEWALHKSSRLTLVGIANALDLTDRFLPRLKSRNLKPELLPFLPYTALQVKEIITTRLRSLLPNGTEANPNYLPFFHPAAIELCSRKVSSQTGDLRRAFEVCRRALDLVESETRTKHENEFKEQILLMSPSRKVLGENRNFCTPAGPQQSVSALLSKALQSLTAETAPRVSIAHLNKVTVAAFSHGTAQRLKMLNLQQKAALCALVAIEKRNRATATANAKAGIPSTPSSRNQVKAPTVKTLYEAYSLLCKRDTALHPLSASEFREVIGSLETLSLITEVDGKTGSFAVLQTPGSGRGRKKKDVFGLGGSAADEKRVASCVGEQEMEPAVDGMGSGILRSILNGEALDY